MTRGRATLILLSGLSVGCGRGAFPKPLDLPESVTPGWTQTTGNSTAGAVPLPSGARADCRATRYRGGQGASAQVWVCGFASESGAFDALQRTRAEANTVKFQENRYLIVLQWTGAGREEVTALVRAVQRSAEKK